MTESLKDYLPLDPKYFKAFMAAADSLNFTTAATETCMTQSGISQHIAKLEEQIGLPLFKRTGKKVVLNDTGKELVYHIKQQTSSTECFLDTVRVRHNSLSGLVRYAMPPSCLYSPHFPMLLEQRKKHPGITLDVTLTPSPQIIQMALENKVDFGFITTATDHQQIDKTFFCQEEYIMVGTNSVQHKRFASEHLLNQQYIMYPGVDVYYDSWLKHQFSENTTMQSSVLPIAGRIDSIGGAISMVVGGLGISVFPRHCVEELLQNGTLHEFFGGNNNHLLNDIHIIKISNHRYPQRIEQVINWFLDMKKHEAVATNTNNVKARVNKSSRRVSHSG